MMNSGIKVTLCLAAVVSAYLIGKEIGKENEEKKSKEQLVMYKENNAMLVEKWAVLSAENRKLKTFYDIVEGIKIGEA